MTGPPNSFTARGPVTLTTILCKKDTRAAYQKNSDAKKLRRIFQVPMEIRPFSAGVNLIVLKLLHLKMEVTVSEPFDVIRVVCIDILNKNIDIFSDIQSEKFLRVFGIC